MSSFVQIDFAVFDQCIIFFLYPIHSVKDSSLLPTILANMF